MEEKDYELMLSLYLDNELDTKNTNELLIHLSNCSNCQDLLASYNKLKNSVNDFYSSFDKGSYILLKTRRKRRKNLVSLSIAAAIVFIIFTVFNVVKPVFFSPIQNNFNFKDYINIRQWTGQVSEIQNKINILENEIKNNPLN